MYQPNHFNRVREVINLYRSDPRSFNDKELDELQELADGVGIKFHPIRNETNMINIMKQAVSGFVEGLTTLPVGQKPRNTYEAISHSLGHLVGFAPAILAGPLGLASKGAQKIGMKAISKGLQKGVQVSQVLDKIAIPMVASRFTKKGLDYGLKKAGLESMNFLKHGAKARGILEEAVGLGAAVSISSVWKGPDAMMDGFVGGAIAGGAFGGIGNFMSISNRLKFGNASQRMNAEKALKGVVGATMLGLPTYLRGEPIEMVMYETLLGGFFGYNARPAHQVAGGKFIQRDLYGTEKGRVFHPEGSKMWDVMHPKAQEYIKKQSTDMAKTWLGKNFDSKWVDTIVENDVVAKAKDVSKIPEADRDASYRNLAYELYQEQSPSAGTSVKAPPPSLEEDAEDGIYREDSDHSVMYTDIVGMMNQIGNSIKKHSKDTKVSPKQIAKDINQRYTNSKNSDEFIAQMKTSSMGKAIDKGMERRLRQFYHNRSKAPKNVYVIEVDKNGARTRVLNGRWEGKKVGMSMIDMPVHYLDPNGKHTAITHIKVNRPYMVEQKDGTFKKKDKWVIINPFKSTMIFEDYKLISERGITGDEYFNIEHQLHKGGQYVHGGKKDNKEMWLRDYHTDSKKVTPAQLIDLLTQRGSKEHTQLVQSLKDSRKLAYKWYDMAIPKDPRNLKGREATILEMHDKAWASNVLVLAERNGLHTTGQAPTKAISNLMSDKFGKNVIDFNKREQMLYDRSVPQDASVYTKELPDGKLRYIILNDKENNSKTDGSVIMRQAVFDKGIKNMGHSEKAGMLKSVFVNKDLGGLIHVKNGTRRANDVWEKFLKDNDIDVVFFDSAVKQKGHLDKIDYTVDNGNINVTGDILINNMPVKNFRINASTFESDKLGFIGIPKQVSSILSNDQSPGMAKYFFDTIIKPDLKGIENYDIDYKTDSDVIKALDNDSKFVFKMPIKDIIKHLKEDTPLARRIRKQILKMDEIGELFEYGDSDYEAFHERNLRLFKLGDASLATTTIDKYGYKYWEPTLRRFIISRYMQPRWEYSSKAVLIPNTPDMPIVKVGTIRLDEGQRNMPVKIKDMPSIKTLGQLYNLYTAKNTSAKLKKQLRPYMDLTVVRIPADSISGIRILRLDGFTGERGFGALTSPKDDVYLGGADKDIDSVHIFHGFDKKIKDSYKNHKNEWKDTKVKDNDDIFLEGSKKEGEVYKTIASKFSPSMRKLVAEAAVRGKDGLGFGLTAKSVVTEWADIVARKGGSISIPMITKKGKNKGKRYGTLSLVLKKDGYEKLRELGKDVVNYSADASNYSNLISPVKYRDVLFNSVFEAYKIPYGKSTWSTEQGTFQHAQGTWLRQVNELVSIINAKGKDYTLNKAHDINDLVQFLTKFESNDIGAENIHAHIARQMIKDGVHKQFKTPEDLLALSRVSAISDKNTAKLTGIKDINPFTKQEIDKALAEGEGNPLKKFRDFVYKNIFSTVSRDTIAKRAMDLVNQFKIIELKPKDMQTFLDNIREEALRIKALSSNDPKVFDGLVRSYKLELKNKLAKVKLEDAKIAHELFDMWLISPFEIMQNGKVTKTQVNILPIESYAVSDSAIRKMQYNLNEHIKPSTPKPETLKTIVYNEGNVVLNKSKIINIDPKKIDKEITWVRGGKSGKRPISTQYYGDKGTEYEYSEMGFKGKWEPLDWTPELLKLKKQVEKITGVKFNSAVVNKYNNQKDSIGFHADNEPELGINPIIASVSFGESANFKLKNLKTNEITSVPLESGDLLVMQGTTQKDYYHGITKGAFPKGQRLNITFRRTRMPESEIYNKYGIKTESKKEKIPYLTDKLERMAITEADSIEITKLKENLENNKQWKENFRDMFQEYTSIFELAPRDETTITMRDIYSINNYLKRINSHIDTPELLKSAWYQDLRFLDEKHKAYDSMVFHQYQTTIITKDGPVQRTLKRSFSTLGTMRNWMHKVFYQQDAMLESIDPLMEEVFKFKKELNIKDSYMINDLVYKLRELTHQKGDRNEVFKDPAYIKNKDRVFVVDGKRYKLEEIIRKVDSDYTKAYQKFGEEWVWTPKKDKYLKYDGNGKIDVMHFLKQAVVPVENGGKLPHVPLETVLKYHYEVKMEKFLNKWKFEVNKKNRELYREGKLKITKRDGTEVTLDTKWKPINRIKAEEYFPKRYGFTNKARKEIDRYIDVEAQKIYDREFRKTDSKVIAERASELFKAKLQMAVEGSIADTSRIETHILDEIAAKIDYKKLSADAIASELGDIGTNTRPDSSIERILDLPVGFDTSPDVINKYMKQIIRSHYKLIGAAMANYRIEDMIKRQAFETDINGKPVKYTKKQKARLEEDGYRNHTDVWADFLRMYVRDAFGHQTTFPQRIIDAMGRNDSLKLKKNFYYITSDQAIINGVESLNKKWLERTGKNFPLLRKLPIGNSPEIQKAKAEYYSRVMHKWGGLEARFQLITLLANTGTMTANVFGGTTMNVSSAGFRNVVRAHNMGWIKKNILDKHEIYLDRKTESGKKIRVMDKETLYEWVGEQGAIDSFIKNEFEINEGLKKVTGVTRQNLNNFRKELLKLLKKDPSVKDEALKDLARKYGVQDLMLKFGGSFMQVSERYLRTVSFLSHALQARDAFGKYGAEISIDDPFIIDMGLKGIENTQFLYHSAFRPAFMRTSLGKVLTRFKLFAFQSVRSRKEYYKMAKQFGFEDDKESMRKFKSLLTLDLLTFALGSIYTYSLFDTALPPPWDWLQEISEWMFGNKREKERAFFGTYPYPLAPLQIITPPVARVPMSIFSAAINNDWDRFADYHLHTMYPFGRIIRNIDKTIYDKNAGWDIIKESPVGSTFGRFMKQFFRMPVNKISAQYDRSVLYDKREDYMEQLMEAI